jgi:hypothetical protein
MTCELKKKAYKQKSENTPTRRNAQLLIMDARCPSDCGYLGNYIKDTDEYFKALKKITHYIQPGFDRSVIIGLNDKALISSDLSGYASIDLGRQIVSYSEQNIPGAKEIFIPYKSWHPYIFFYQQIKLDDGAKKKKTSS